MLVVIDGIEYLPADKILAATKAANPLHHFGVAIIARAIQHIHAESVLSKGGSLDQFDKSMTQLKRAVRAFENSRPNHKRKL